MVDEVVAGEGVDELALAAPVRDGDGDELAVARRGRQAPGTGQQAVRVGGDERRRDEERRPTPTATGASSAAESASTVNQALTAPSCSRNEASTSPAGSSSTSG